VIAGPRSIDDEGFADAVTANPVPLSRLHPGIGPLAWRMPASPVSALVTTEPLNVGTPRTSFRFLSLSSMAWISPTAISAGGTGSPISRSNAPTRCTRGQLARASAAGADRASPHGSRMRRCQLFR